MRRWLDSLVKADFVRETNGVYVANMNVSARHVAKLWEQLFQSPYAASFGVGSLQFYDDCRAKLPSLLSGERDALDLLFPGGELNVANAVYSEMFARKVMFRLVNFLQSIIALHAEGGQRLDIMEVGAGMGGLTSALLPQIPFSKVAYEVTDVSQFFLVPARKQFSNYSSVSYSLFDINKPLAEQEHHPGSKNIILAHNVLHTSFNVSDVVANLKSLLKPGG